PGGRPIIMRMVHLCSKCVKIPIIGVGGISRAEDVIEYMMAGATAVQVGYASFRNPTAMIAMIDGIEQWCEAHGVAKVSELTGSMIDHPPRDTYEAGMMGIS
ncbi:MAG: dihydroorotate dehydrogenase, partial [bacterium]